MEQNENKYIGLAIQYKKMLTSIIETAYRDHYRLNRYKAFKVVCVAEPSARALGRYTRSTRTITLFDVNTAHRYDLVVTAIHELSHHIECIDTGTSGHQESFYQIHKKLLFAAFDMKLLSPDDVIQCASNSARNNNKLAAMMKDYVPHPIHTEDAAFSLHVYDAYAYKDVLKSRGYHYNALDRSWDKSFPAECAEIGALIELGIPLESIRVSNSIAPIKNTMLFCYWSPRKEANAEIKAQNYRWNPNSRRWEKPVLPQDVLEYTEKAFDLLQKHPSLAFHIDTFHFRVRDNGIVYFYNYKTRKEEPTTARGFVYKYLLSANH